MSGRRVLQERLAKVLSRCGVASRRRAELLISQGRVKVNGFIAIDLGKRINPFEDTVVVDDKEVKLLGYTTWMMINKPRTVISSAKDDKGRKTVVDLVDFKGPQLVPVGRLDRDTSGKWTHAPKEQIGREAKTWLMGAKERRKITRRLTRGRKIEGVYTQMNQRLRLQRQKCERGG